MQCLIAGAYGWRLEYFNSHINGVWQIEQIQIPEPILKDMLFYLQAVIYSYLEKWTESVSFKISRFNSFFQNWCNFCLPVQLVQQGKSQFKIHHSIKSALKTDNLEDFSIVVSFCSLLSNTTQPLHTQLINSAKLLPQQAQLFCHHWPWNIYYYSTILLKFWWWSKA